MAYQEYDGIPRRNRAKSYVFPSRERRVLWISLAVAAVLVIGLIAVMLVLSEVGVSVAPILGAAGVAAVTPPIANDPARPAAYLKFTCAVHSPGRARACCSAASGSAWWTISACRPRRRSGPGRPTSATRTTARRPAPRGRRRWARTVADHQRDAVGGMPLLERAQLVGGVDRLRQPQRLHLRHLARLKQNCRRTIFADIGICGTRPGDHAKMPPGQHLGHGLWLHRPQHRAVERARQGTGAGAHEGHGPEHPVAGHERDDHHRSYRWV